MFITINKVEIEKTPKGYMVAKVHFVRNGEEGVRDIPGFAAPSLFNKLASWSQQEGKFPLDVNVILERDGKYWNWKDMEMPRKPANKAQEKETESGGEKRDNFRGGRVVGSNFETPEERARRQIYIIRQSSVSSAIEFVKACYPQGVASEGFDVNLDKVLEIAKEIEKFVRSEEE